ncbi:MAG TPA: hypothetical protein VMH34_07030 [Gammaproteobacteria bacterium]|nr:hypothetical protein [Gammaproteobacteria bacterium]
MPEPLPQYIHDRIFDLATAMKDASERGDPAMTEECYEEMRDYCLALIDEGRECAFLWETLGDFTREDDQALQFYERALSCAEHDKEAVHDILIAMGERYSDKKSYALARELLSRGLRLAFAAGDTDMAARADVLLGELPS